MQEIENKNKHESPIKLKGRDGRADNAQALRRRTRFFGSKPVDLLVRMGSNPIPGAKLYELRLNFRLYAFADVS